MRYFDVGNSHMQKIIGCFSLTPIGGLKLPFILKLSKTSFNVTKRRIVSRINPIMFDIRCAIKFYTPVGMNNKISNRPDL